MSSMQSFLERHHAAIIYAQLGLIVLFVIACTFNGVLPVCHWLFDCDHAVAH